MIEQESVKGFPEVVVGTNVSDCISHVIQVDVISIPKDILWGGFQDIWSEYSVFACVLWTQIDPNQIILFP